MFFQEGGPAPYRPFGESPTRSSLDIAIEMIVNRAIDARMGCEMNVHYFREPEKIPTLGMMQSAIQSESDMLRAELPHLIKQVLRDSLPRGLRWLIR